MNTHRALAALASIAVMIGGFAVATALTGGDASGIAACSTTDALPCIASAERDAVTLRDAGPDGTVVDMPCTRLPDNGLRCQP